jgi:hypothetical protein
MMIRIVMPKKCTLTNNPWNSKNGTKRNVDQGSRKNIQPQTQKNIGVHFFSHSLLPHFRSILLKNKLNM